MEPREGKEKPNQRQEGEMGVEKGRAKVLVLNQTHNHIHKRHLEVIPLELEAKVGVLEDATARPMRVSWERVITTLTVLLKN
jgi:hypothetical protein